MMWWSSGWYLSLSSYFPRVSKYRDQQNLPKEYLLNILNGKQRISIKSIIVWYIFSTIPGWNKSVCNRTSKTNIFPNIRVVWRFPWRASWTRCRRSHRKKKMILLFAKTSFINEIFLSTNVVVFFFLLQKWLKINVTCDHIF